MIHKEILNLLFRTFGIFQNDLAILWKCGNFMFVYNFDLNSKASIYTYIVITR